ncbi:hypothetical protein A2X44_02005 [candidate division CPR3 bacterium GWF2_35_18]|uniref:Fimbrial assembly family protein n=1 Tax=candidate division CPR3 bacterium GW2011_GWF2_35_18 TaxID=1618350 RepID=A0A0G0E3R7_UNCC3|nr:MAG: hypothetical protein UR67_C0002G0085 [candidate division CPR3 bacterium GW2011_GWF2_35_18]OGB62773.1 MAG: hypothetical protein A2X44_02005 [candidate division CPR3 bacterium GWF2_35_18]OGB65354.1 MAG: hypothetical protein A2250_00220 [candidate division CPR3 bacterium RIFOXYA2_FULL_35_13]OGB77032.1 MAG: hypothetical protein A2476_01105 [candidate division CPR3 bacterium RIFOXYC2_FULL_35_7]OGB79141.1 MAG: hypothetical protein A2296_01810 [candidate division CPR3 bacterium RIFOXYB2_FULL_3
MAVNINLLPDIKSDEKKKKKLLQTINIVSLAVTGFILLIAIGVFVINQILNSNLSEINESILAQEKIVDENLEAETVLVGLQSRLSSIDSILVTRKKYSVFLTNFTSYVPQSIIINDMTVGSDGSVLINGEAPSYEKLAGFVLVLSGENTLESTEEATVDVSSNSIYSNVSLNSVSRGDDGGSVRFTISFTAKEGAFHE